MKLVKRKNGLIYGTDEIKLNLESDAKNTLEFMARLYNVDVEDIVEGGIDLLIEAMANDTICDVLRLGDWNAKVSKK